MRTGSEYDNIMKKAHQLEILLSANNPEELRYDDTIPMALQVVMDGLDIPKPDKVKFLHRVMALYV